MWMRQRGACAHRGGTSEVKFGSDPEAASAERETDGTRGETRVFVSFDLY